MANRSLIANQTAKSSQMVEFVKKIIKNYHIHEEKQDQLYNHIHTYVKKCNRQNLQTQIRKFLQNKNEKEKKKKSFEEKVSEILKSYEIEEDDFLQQMENIKNCNFGGFINLILKEKRDELSNKLNALIKSDQKCQKQTQNDKSEEKIENVQPSETNTDINRQHIIKKVTQHQSIPSSEYQNCKNQQKETHGKQVSKDGTEKINTCFDVESHLQKKCKEQIDLLQKKIEEFITVSVQYQTLTKTYHLTPYSSVKELKSCIEKDFIPIEFQQLQLMKGDSTINLSESDNDKSIFELCETGKTSLSITLSNSAVYQYYGFNQNIEQTHKQFTEFTTNSYESLLHTIQHMNFSAPEQQLQFSKKLIGYLFSSVKKGFPIESILRKVKAMVGKEKPMVDIWVPMKMKRSQRMNESFVLMYLLTNSEHKLRIALMNLVKNFMPIPLFIAQFSNIFERSPRFELNEEIYWVLKKGLTVGSIGLHSEQKQQYKNQGGKSLLLKEIFDVSVCAVKNRHRITQGVPYVYANIYEEAFPLNIIDIPRECQNQERVLRMCDVVLVHSWKSKSQTERYVQQVERQYGCRSIVILRDCELEERSRKQSNEIRLPNLEQYSESMEGFMNRVRQKIYKKLYEFNKEGVQGSNGNDADNRQNSLTNSKKIFSIFDNKKYELNQLGDIIENFRGNNINICQFAKCSPLYNVRQSDIEKEHKKLNQNIEKILHFMSQCKIPLQSVIIYVRQKLKNLQKETINKYNKIYGIKKGLFKTNEVPSQLAILLQTIRELPEKYHKEKKQQIEKLLAERLSEEKEKEKEKGNEKADKKKNVTEIVRKLDDIMQEFENEIKPNIFTIELFWREIYGFMKLHPKHRIGSRELSALITELKSKEIMSNQSFELIDGDSLEMQVGTFRKAFQTINDNCLVISILGPQSSGKSTLLNFLFGCDFSVSEGRCTRGLYGTYFRLSGEQGSGNSSSILVIDTEGIFAITNNKDRNEKQRRNLDSKLILFCLAVSDFTIINVRGNIDSRTENMLKVCHEKIKVLNLEENNRLEIVMVLNQNNTTRTEESENEFKSIRNKIHFTISKSLPQAYSIKMLTKQEICLLENELLTKKIPLSSFQQQTEQLLNEMMDKVKWQNCDKVEKRIGYFNTMWETVMAFSNFSRMMSNEQRQLKAKIKQWKKPKQDQLEDGIAETINKAMKEDMREEDAVEAIKSISNRYLEEFLKKFERESCSEELKNSMEEEKQKICLKNGQFIQQLKYRICERDVQRLAERQQWQNNRELRNKEQQIIKEQSKSKKRCEDEQKRRIFKQIWETSIGKLKQIILNKKNDQRLEKKLMKIRNYYSFLIEMSNSRESEFGLFQDKSIEPNYQQITTLSTEKIGNILTQAVYKTIGSHSQFMVYTNKPHTNLTKGGRTDAKLKYFNIDNYFYKKNATDVYSLSKKAIVQHFKMKQFTQKNRKILNKQLQNNNILSEVNKQLLEKFGFVVQNAEICAKEKTIASEQWDTAIRITQKQGFALGNFVNVDSELIRMSLSEVAVCKDAVWSLKSVNEIKTVLQNNIKWQEIAKPKDSFIGLLNTDLKNINASISTKNAIFEKLFENNENKKEELVSSIFQSIAMIDKRKRFETKFQITNCLNQLRYFDGRKLQEQLRINEYNEQHIIIGTIQYECLVEKYNFLGYNERSRSIKDKFKNNAAFKQQIFKKMQQKQSIKIFLTALIEIVNNVVEKWKNEITNKAIQQIYSSVNNEICAFNNDLNQISHQLSDRMVGFAHLMVVYMIWKFEVEKEMQREQQFIKKKEGSRQNELEKFMKITSNDLNEITEVEVEEFVKAVKKKFTEIIDKKKQTSIQIGVNKFKATVQRKEIIETIDAEIFAQSTDDWNILHYLENPHKIIEKKYEQRYRQLLKEVEEEFVRNNYAKQLNELFTQVFRKMLQTIKIGNNRKQGKNSDCDCQQQKKLLFVYFIEQAVKYSKSIKIEQETKYISTMPTSIESTNSLLKQILQNLKKDKQIQLKMTDLPKFLQFLQTNNCFPLNSLQQICKFDKKQKNTLINSIRVVICEQKCPCCNRICDVEQTNHQFHECLYGHQVRALAGNYIETIRYQPCKAKCQCKKSSICGKQQNHQYHIFDYCNCIRKWEDGDRLQQREIKQAFVQRCEQIAQTQQIQFNGRALLWSAFKKQMEEKTIGGWKFNEGNNEDKEKNRKRFMAAWRRAGPLYCKEHQMEYVERNEISLIRGKGLENTHFIFLLDESTSMMGEPWRNLLLVLKETLTKIKKISQKSESTKVSVINFHEKARIIYERQQPSSINVDKIPFCGGSTNFTNAFKKIYQIVKKNVENEKMVIMFMSDGQGTYPSEPIEQLKLLMKQHKQQIHYFGLFLGYWSYSQQVLTQIQRQLKGKNFFAADFKELMKAYQQCIEIMQRKKPTE